MSRRGAIKNSLEAQIVFDLLVLQLNGIFLGPDIGNETRTLAGLAREMKLQPEDYQGSTFTVSNLGMMGIEHFTAIINPPNSAILAVGSLQQEPVVVAGSLSVGWRMKVTMSCDHRVIDGALGAQFLLAVRKYIENPVLMVI